MTGYTSHMVKALFISAVTFLLLACQPVKKVTPAPVMINKIQVLNLSNHTLEEVRISVPSSSSRVNCDQLAPGGFCANQFKPRVFRNNRAEVIWEIAGQRWHKTVEPDQIEIPNGWTLVSLELVLDASGGAHVRPVRAN